MNESRERDEAIEGLIRQSLRAQPAAGARDGCLDAEAMAAFLDGGLAGPALESAQDHVAGCDRCQALVGAIVRLESDEPEAAPGRPARGWRLGWLVPATAAVGAAAAVALYLAIPGDDRAPLPLPAEVRQTEPKAQEPGLPSDRFEAPAATAAAQRAAPSQAGTPASPSVIGGLADSRPGSAGARDRVTAAEPGRDNGRPKAGIEAQERASARAADQSRAAPLAESVTRPGGPPADKAAAMELRADANTGARAVEIATSDPAIRWRIAGSRVERSTDGGARWLALPTDNTTELIAGAAPAPTVCWMVGRGGVVLLSTDGSTVRRLPFPETTDLSSVSATDARAASVTAADGRVFTTADAGATWIR